MEKYCKGSHSGVRRLGAAMLALALFSLVEHCAADTLEKCDAHAKLPKHLSHITFKGEGAEGCDNPVVIEHAKNSSEGIAAEKVWMKTCYPTARIKTKALSRRTDKVYEVVEIKLQDQTSKRICFDVSNFFGSW